MTIIYIDPYCSGLKVLNYKNVKKINAELVETYLKSSGMDEDTYSGESIYYVAIKEDTIIKGKLDYT